MSACEGMEANCLITPVVRTGARMVTANEKASASCSRQSRRAGSAPPHARSLPSRNRQSEIIDAVTPADRAAATRSLE
jgi:hypothetical protein